MCLQELPGRTLRYGYMSNQQSPLAVPPRPLQLASLRPIGVPNSFRSRTHKRNKGLRMAAFSRIFPFLEHAIPFTAVTRVRCFARN
jgi:hypothetical protein